jgi:methylene-tetrahydromethanopterin dehydrogenase
MEKPFILHMFTPVRQMSPFDINMAYDAGYQHVVPYTDVTLDQITGLVQDAIFSRGPKGVKRTGIFIGGRDIALAADMLDVAKRAMVPPFEVSVFADPSGAFTTAAAMVACVERQLRKTHQTDLKGRDVLVLGGTGPVGMAAAVLAADAGANVRIGSHSSPDRARIASEMANARYGAKTVAADASKPDSLVELLNQAEIIMSAAKAGAQVLSEAQVASAKRLLVAADVNAVPPAGIAGIGAMDDGVAIKTLAAKTVGIGALAIGNVKYQVERGLFETMLQADKAVYLDFRDAFALARKHAA